MVVSARARFPMTDDRLQECLRREGFEQGYDRVSFTADEGVWAYVLRDDDRIAIAAPNHLRRRPISSGSQGFATYPSNPASTAFCTSSGCAYPLTAMSCIPFTPDARSLRATS